MQLDYKGTVDPKLGREHIGFRVLGSKKRGEEVVLRPGVNTLTDAEWAGVKDSAGAKHLIATGQLHPLVGKGKDGKAGAFSITKDASPQEALSLVKRTTEPGPLREWLTQLEGAGAMWKHVAAAASEQLTEVTTDVHGQPAEQRPLKMVG